MGDREDDWWRAERGDLIVSIRVQPNARRDEVVGVADGRLRVKLAAPPVAGRANEALRRFVAERFGVRRSAVQVKFGASSRDKVVTIVGLDRPPAGLLRR